MNEHDAVFSRLSELERDELPLELSARVRERALARLGARPIGRVWTLAVAGTVVGYLGWALHFASQLLVPR